jgi:hypothetical protein
MPCNHARGLGSATLAWIVVALPLVLAASCGSDSDEGAKPSPDASESGVAGGAGSDAQADASIPPDSGPPDASEDHAAPDAAEAGDAESDGNDAGTLCIPDPTDPDLGCGSATCQPCDIPGATATCVSGACALDFCNPGYSDCNGDPSDGCEVEIASSTSNCGSCGNACVVPNAVPSCVSGKCEIGACSTTWFVDCNLDPADGCEIDVSADPNNCGSCSNTCTLVGGAPICNGGTCGVSQCEKDKGDCDGNPANGCEANLDGDPANCGFCGNLCALPNAVAGCAGGSCQVASCNPGFDDCDGVIGNGCEANLSGSAASCGACGTVCSNAHGSTSCVTGACQPSCSAGYADCDGDPNNGCELSVAANVDNCGACGAKCLNPNGQTACSAGVCKPTCSPGFASCDANPANGCETPTGSDPTNCGGCGVVCGGANGVPGCSGGGCTITCNSGFGNCDKKLGNGCETALVSLTNCGACGTACTRANASATCATGSCQIASCNPGFANCDGQDANGCEVNTSSSAGNCGGCGQACSSAGGVPSCSGSTCSISCNSGFGNCDGLVSNGCEANLGTNSSHCGACGTACTNPNGTTSCSGGACVPACSAGFGNCNGNPNDGCETNTKTSTSHCGSCGNVCSCPSGTANCVNGICGCTSCNAGTGDCDGNAANGCETNVTSNVSHCGGCGNVCSSVNGTPSCSAGTCSIACNAGFGNCDNSAANGCETALNTLTSCGACGASCSRPNATATCATGSCMVSSCNAGFGNCDGNHSNGCETNLSTTVANCGSCGNACSSANGTAACSAGQCTITCNAGFGNCDGDASNGCETALNTTANCGSCGSSCSFANGVAACSAGSCVMTGCASGWGDCDNQTSNGCETSLTTLSNCGTCGNACTNPHGSTTCSGGSCSPSCSAGWGNCDSNPNNGCETSLTTLSNCGACGQTCALANATASCGSGSCQVASCNTGFQNCDNQAANGCEVNTQTSVTNCGSCGTVCSSANGTRSCALGACAIACNSGWGNCDGNAQTNGCETNLNTSANNCGVCGKICSPGQTCVNGVCLGSTCGNGTIEPGEHCDDGNTKNLDGCDASCKYEVVQRVTSLQVRTGTSPAYCSPTTNRFGQALSSSAANSFNSNLQGQINAGELNTLMQLLFLDDLSGQNDPTLQVGVVNGALDPKRGGWVPPGAIDWWFLADTIDLDSAGLPLQRMTPASITNRLLAGGPSLILLNYGGSPLKMRGAAIRATIGTATNVPAPPPSSLAAGLTVFQTMAANTSGQGLCGNITVGSLAAIPAPQDLTTSGADSTTRCRSSCSNSREYTYCGLGNPVGPGCNSLLDVIVSGCRTTILCVTAISRQQPDVGVGGNPPNVLTANSSTGKVTVTQPDDAYSSYFYLATQRAHLTNNLP